MKPLIFGYLILISLIACSATPTPNEASGIEGQVLLGPTCPVVRPNDPACNNKPYQARLTVLTTSGQRVTQFTTDAEGKFHLDLNPGDYVLHPESPNGARWPYAQEQSFTVIAGQFTLLSITYDSGIR